MLEEDNTNNFYQLIKLYLVYVYLNFYIDQSSLLNHNVLKTNLLMEILLKHITKYKKDALETYLRLRVCIYMGNVLKTNLLKENLNIYPTNPFKISTKLSFSIATFFYLLKVIISTIKQL